MSPHSRFAQRFAFGLIVAGLSGGAGLAQTPADAPVKLAPHRAVYDISLDSKTTARNIDSASGRLAYDITGDACSGHASSYRQVTILEGAETGRRMIDTQMTLLEEPERAGFRFKINSTANGSVSEAGDGRVRRKGEAYVIAMTKPRREERPLSGEVIFPSEHLRRIIVAAMRGEQTLETKVFDGSEEGKLVYDTLTVIGARVSGDAALEEPLKAAAGLAAVPRWPVTISYFRPGQGDRTPSYVVGFELYANGVARALKMDYGVFALQAKLTRLELYPAPACEK